MRELFQVDVGRDDHVLRIDQHVMDAFAARERRPTHRGFSLQSLDIFWYISGARHAVIMTLHGTWHRDFPLAKQHLTDARDEWFARARDEWFARLLKRNMEHYEELRDPVAHRKKMAETIDWEIAMRVAELERCGIRNPVTQAKEEAAKRWHHDNVEALDRWLRRNR